MIHQKEVKVMTPGRKLIDITSHVEQVVACSDIYVGLCCVFIQHTSASLLISENADFSVQHDLEDFLYRLVPDDIDLHYQHNQEGIDDMPAHIRSVLTQSSIAIPVNARKLMLGTWQGIFLWEHRLQPHERTFIVSVIG